MSHTGEMIPLRVRLAERMRKTSPATLWGGLLLSLMLHTGVIAFIYWQMRPLGDGSPPNTGDSEFNAVGIVEKSSISKQNQNAESENDSNETTASNKYSPTAPKNAKNSEVPDAPPVNIEQTNTGRSVIGPGLKSTAVAPRGDPGNVRPSRIGPPPSASAGSRGNGTGSFFDIEIEGGKRIVYLLDRSPSMHDQPLRLAKQKLIASLNGLNLDQRFQVIFFNNRLLPVTISTGSSDPLAPGSKSNVLTAKLKIEGVKEAGSTNHKLALRAALEKSRSPDVVFFLTDSHGLTGHDRTLANADLQEILRLNKSRARIHCIEFGEGADLSRGDNFLKQLAASTRGRYVYVDVKKLRLR